METHSFLMHVNELSRKDACEFVSKLLDKIVVDAVQSYPTLPTSCETLCEA